MTINTLIAELRAGLPDIRFGAEAFPAQMEVRHLRALLDHIDRLTSERDAADDRLDAVRIDLLTEQSERKVAEAELARLRAPVMEGEVGDCLAKLNNRKVNEPDFGMRLRHEAADLLQRLAGQVRDREDDAYIARIMAMTPEELARMYPSPDAMNADVEAGKRAFAETRATTAEARLREAVEVIALFRERIEARGEWDDGCFYHNRTSASELQEPLTRARAFLSTLEDHSNGS